MIQRHFLAISKFLRYEVMRHNRSHWKEKPIEINCDTLDFNDTINIFRCTPLDPFKSHSSADSFLDLHEVTGYHKVILILTLVVILFLAIVGNILVMATVMFNKVMWTTMHVFIVSLAVSDTLVSITCIPLNLMLVANTEFMLGDIACQLMTFLMQCSITASTLTLCCMAGERYFAIVHPLRFGFVQTLHRAILILILVWLLALLTGSPYLYFSKVRRWPKPCAFGQYCPEESQHAYCGFRDGYDRIVLTLHWLNVVSCYFLPIVIILITYGIIVYKLWVKAPVGTVVLSVTGQRNRYRKKAVKMLLLVVLLFIICWTPIEVLEVVYILHRQVAQPQKAYLKFYLQCLAFSSTALNPFVYAFLNNKFRKSFINFMPRRSRRVAPMNVPDPPQLPSDAACNKTGTSSESYNSKSRMCSLRSTKSTEL